jgi:hypothetical protein
MLHSLGQYNSYPPHSCLLSRRIHPHIIPQHFGANCCVICVKCVRAHINQVFLVLVLGFRF